MEVKLLDLTPLIAFQEIIRLGTQKLPSINLPNPSIILKNIKKNLQHCLQKHKGHTQQDQW